MSEASSLLDIRDIAKNFGSVVALRAAALNVRAGEVHALMGANGAGKSTLVKILTGVFPADAGTIILDGKTRSFRSPAEARAAGIVSVYQDPALVPDLTVAQNLRLAKVPLNDTLRWLAEHGVDGSRSEEASIRKTFPIRSCASSDLAQARALPPEPKAPSSRRDHGRAIGGSGGKSLRHGSSPPRTGPFGHIHFAPHGRGLGHMRPGDSPARRNHRRRHRCGAGQPGAYRHIDARNGNRQGYLSSV